MSQEEGCDNVCTTAVFIAWSMCLYMFLLFCKTVMGKYTTFEEEEGAVDFC